MKRVIFFLVLLIWVLFCFTQDVSAIGWGKEIESKTFGKNINAEPGNTLVIDLRHADLTVSPGDGSRISVKAVVEVKSSQPGFSKNFLAGTELILEPYRQGARLKLKTPRGESGFWKVFINQHINLSISSRVEVKVPARQSLDIHNKYGEFFRKDFG